MSSVYNLCQNNQRNDYSSANENSNLEHKTGTNQIKTQINSNYLQVRQFEGFSILAHIDKLQPAKGSNRYICPVCDGNDLTIDPNTGKYQCWHGCECSDIREAISPWSEIVANSKNDSHFDRSKKPRFKSKKPTLPVLIPEAKIVLATLPEAPIDNPRIKEKPFIPAWATEKYGIPQECEGEIIYEYSTTQWVSRYEWSDPTHPKGRKKHPHPKHLDNKGKGQWNKGKSQWQAYRIEEAIANCQDKWILALEGENCVEAARTLQLAAITWQGGSWTEEEIEIALKKLKNNGALGLIVPRDNDQAGIKKGLLILEVCSQLNLPCLIIEPTDIWSDMPPLGDIVDWVKQFKDSMSRNEFIEQLELAIHKAVERRKEQQKEITGDDTDKDKFSRIPNWSQSDIANWLAEIYRPQLAWNTESQEWYRYSAQTEGIWSKEPVEFIGSIIKAEVESIANLYAKFNGEDKRPKYTITFINGIASLLKLDLAVRKWNKGARGLLPLLNGVFDLKTNKLIPHAPGHRLTWCLPYNYNPLTCCDPIINWLTTMCGGDLQLVQLMRAYLYGIVTGRTDWQKYLELIGPGGTGKSTLTRLAIALVGANNTHTTTLKKLEGERFETASIADKRLVLINDSERYAGSVSTLKALTGQDTLPHEIKFKQSTGGFTPTAMVIVAANETIQSRDYTSGLERRRVTVPMLNKIPSENQRNLIEHRDGEIFGEFAPYIPGLLNWVLEMDEAEATHIIKNYQKAVPGLAAMKAQTLVESNPIADWLDNNIIYRQDYRTNIGVAQRDKDNNSDHWYLNTDKWLYANYREYCQNTGSKSIGVRRFVNLLSDLCQNQLGLNAVKGRDRNGSYFLGLKIRAQNDEFSPIITGKISSPNTDSLPPNTTHNTWPTVTDSVTAESIGSKECYRCDCQIETRSENLTSKKNNSNNTTAINCEDLPSHPSRNVPQSPSGDELEPIPNPSLNPSQPITQSVTTHHKEENNLEPNETENLEFEIGSFKIGDRVKRKNSPKDQTGTVTELEEQSNQYGVKFDGSEEIIWFGFYGLERAA